MEKKADDVYIVAAAYLSGQGKTQEEIAIDLGISQALVSRLIRRAKEKQYLETRFVSEKVSDEDLARAKARLRKGPLQQLLSQVGVLASGSSHAYFSRISMSQPEQIRSNVAAPYPNVFERLCG